jgi:hypothetical protein
MHAIDGGGGTRCKVDKYLQIPLSSRAVLAHGCNAGNPLFCFDSGALIDEKPAHGQETRDQSQRRIRLFQRRL